MGQIENIRLDILVVNKGLASSREKAKEYIQTGKIFVNGKCIKKSGIKINTADEIEMRGEAIPFVSRAGLKLEKAVDDFNIKLDGLTCIDVGASTGGFTECMLIRGAKKVYAIDVGRDQLVEKLKNDERVVSMEGTNIRAVTPADIGELCDFVSIDVSFISLDKVIPHVTPLLKEGAHGVALIKPQFEAGRSALSKKGVIKSKKVHEEVIAKVYNLLNENRFNILGLDYSGIKGQNGNIEYLIYFTNDAETHSKVEVSDIKELVMTAHEQLNLEEI